MDAVTNLLLYGLNAPPVQITETDLKALLEGAKMPRSTLRVTDGYLLPFLRALLFADELRRRDQLGNWWSVCGSTAQQIADAIVEAAEKASCSYQVRGPVDFGALAKSVFAGAAPTSVESYWGNSTDEQPGARESESDCSPTIQRLESGARSRTRP